jgi:segregation and condensation protein A
MTSMDIAFTVKQKDFEGPMEVLLDLIERRKLFVNDISLATVTDDFIGYIQTKGMLPDQVAHFLSIAATLILIKARSLLPNLELTTDEQESITELERRMALYQLISRAAGDLVKQFGKKISFEGAVRPHAPVFAPDPALSVDTLWTLVGELERQVPPPAPKKPEARVYTTISITEVLSTLRDRMEKAISCSFKDIAVSSPDGDSRSQKVYTIVSFLGMLEMVRNGLIDANQESLFEDIRLEKQAPQV